MKHSTGAFATEDVFYITGRGWVIVGKLSGTVSAGQQLVFETGITLSIKAVSAVNSRSSTERIGLLVSTIFVARREFIDQGITGSLAQIMD